MSHTLQLIHSVRFMASSLSSFVDKLSERIHETKCKYGHYDKNVKLEELNMSIVIVFLNIQTLKMN